MHDIQDEESLGFGFAAVKHIVMQLLETRINTLQIYRPAYEDQFQDFLHARRELIAATDWQQLQDVYRNRAFQQNGNFMYEALVEADVINDARAEQHTEDLSRLFCKIRHSDFADLNNIRRPNNIN